MNVTGWKGTPFEPAWEARRAITPDNTGGYDYAIGAGGKVIVECFEHVGFADDGKAFDRHPAQANARGIAALGELIEALQATLERLHPYAQITLNNPHDGDVAAVELARAALAKAGVS